MPQLPEGVVNALSDVLLESLARITPLEGAYPAGAAFFVSDSLLITCRHVVGDADEVWVTPFGREGRRGTVTAAADPELDISLVQVDPDPANSAVVLHRAADLGDYRLAGFPREDYFEEDAPGAEIACVDGRPRMDASTKRVQLLRLTGVQIKPGFSGGPVLNTRTGAVVAVAVYSENPDDDLGGGALAIDRVLDAYPQLARLAAEPPLAAARCKTILGQGAWEGLGLVWDRNSQIDIYLSGDRKSWRIARRPDSAGPTLTVRDLGDEMSEVLVRWARSSGRRDEAEVRLLGRLLSAALFPPQVAGELPEGASRDSDPVLVRLHVDPTGGLADLPWEFATHPSDPDRFLAVAEGYSFVRVDPSAPVGSGRLAERMPGAPVTVLAIVVQPSDTLRWPTVVDRLRTVPWPRSEETSTRLRDHIGTPTTTDGSPAFRHEVLVNPTLFELKQRGLRGGVDIVHYLGFGYQKPDDAHNFGLDRPWIACGDGIVGLKDPRYHRAKDVLEAIGLLEPTMVILEFAPPPIDQPYEIWGAGCQALGPMVLGAATDLNVDALICTRPLFPMQLELFNEMFYACLAAGQTVEQAVQVSRQAVMTEARVDFAGFGCFMVTTGNSPRMRYFDPATITGSRRATPIHGGN